MNCTNITPHQVEAAQRVVKTYMDDEKLSAMADIREEDITDDFDTMTDEEFYNRYNAHYGHIWFDLYQLSLIK